MKKNKQKEREVDLCKCKKFSGYTIGYKCRICKKPIYTKRKAKEIDEMRKELNPNDVVYTPDEIAEKIVGMFPIKGKVLEPASGEGVFLKYLPKGTDWCEITRGKDFLKYNKKVDWIVTNPPYSIFDKFMQHSFDLADNVVFLVPIAKVLKSWGTIQRIKRYGGIVSIWLVPASRCGFPFGFPAGAFYFRRNYKGATQFSYAKDKNDGQTDFLSLIKTK